MSTTEQITDERLLSLIKKKKDPLSTHVLETKMRNAESDSERELVAMLLGIEYEHREIMIAEASFLAAYGFCATDAVELAIQRWRRHGWRGIHSERAKVRAAHIRYSAQQGLPL